MRVGVYGILGLVASLACSRGSLRGSDAGADGPLPTGRQSFIVVATVKNTGGDATLPVPSSHRFTMVIDWDKKIATIGANGAGGVRLFQPTSAGGSIIPAPRLEVGNYVDVSYQNLDFAIDPSGALTGTAQGQATYGPPTTDIARITTVTASLTGGPDNEPPVFALNGVDVTATDPFSSLMVSASEPLPPDTRLVLTDLRGERIDLLPPTDPSTAAISFAPAAARMWRYQEQYTVSLAGITDFAGNPTAATSATFTIAAPPPLAAEDGFESAIGTTLGGAQVLSETGAPTISGARSLYIPPVQIPLGQGALQQLALRLAVAPGDSVIRFSYRVVKPVNSASSFFDYGFFGMASEGGQIGYPRLALSDAPTTTVSIPSVGNVLVGPIATAEISLPPDAASEITLTRSAPGASGLPAPPVMGLIIDDLRVE